LNFKLPQKDTLLLIALLAVSFVSVYYLPLLINRIIFLLILFAAFRTKLEYVYLVWFFIINDAPGRLFSGGAAEDLRIPIYPLAPGIALSFQDLFLLLYLIKFLSLKKPYPFIFKKEFLYFYLIGFIVIIYSFILGMNADSMISNFRSLIPWCLIFIVPAYFFNLEIVLRVTRFIFPFVVLAFISQLFSYITGNYFDYYLRGLKFSSLAVDDMGYASRSYSAVYLTFYSIIQAFYFYFKRKPALNYNYLGIILFLAFLSIFLTATRGWIIALGFFFTGFFILFWFSRQGFRIFRLIFLSIFAFIVILTLFPLVQKQFERSYERLATLEEITEGDVTAGGTLSRLDVRGPRVIEKFKESPVFGWGFSNTYHTFQDSHVGQLNLLLSIGILGYIFVNGLFIHFCLKIYNLSKKVQIRTIEGKAPLIYLLGLLTVFIVHSSSTQFWGYIMGFDQLNKIIFLAFFFASVNAVFLITERKILKKTE
jgi:hypothetical protein